LTDNDMIHYLKLV